MASYLQISWWNRVRGGRPGVLWVDSERLPEGGGVMTVTRPATLRDRQVLATQLGVSSAECAWTGHQFCLGSRDALRWLLGGGPGPLTGVVCAAPPPRAAIVHELAAAEAVIPRGSAASGYAEGVEHALMWAQLVTPAPPVPTRGRAATVSRGIR
jgi:hypothetical protein